MYGYTLSLIEANKRASRFKLGVKLGRACIAADVPVSDVANHFGVSRQTIYSWFYGRSEPHWRHESAIEQYIEKLA